VVGAIGIAWTNMWGVWPEAGQFDLWLQDLDVGSAYVGIPWECVWILLFPLIVPSTPGKTLLASVGAASAGMMVFTLSKAFGATAADVPAGTMFGYYLFSTYLCAGIAFVISRGVHRYGRRLAKAQEVGSYKLTELLGRGGMGDVWIAEHQMLARPAAIKLIRPEALGSNEAGARVVEERFKREARATAALRSTHTVELYDFGVTDEGLPFLVMEHLRGQMLASMVEGNAFPIERVVTIGAQVLSALAEAQVDATQQDGGIRRAQEAPQAPQQVLRRGGLGGGPRQEADSSAADSLGPGDDRALLEPGAHSHAL